MTNIVLIGASGHAAVIIDIIEKQAAFKLIGLIDAQKPLTESVLNYPILGREQDIPNIANAGIIAIGDNWTRAAVAAKIKAIAPDFQFVTAIHPSATIAKSATLGDGTVVMAGAAINSRARTGEHCIVNTHAVLEHDSELANYACLLPGAITGGNVSIGEYSAICMGARIIHGVKIGEHSVIGASATVLKDIPANVVAHGTPARVIRQRPQGERYL